ncbi:MAG: hypothetical protein FD173_895 [Gallionellaceae bacterium]|nr:MAG: hypothetical protein FD173_895 [Gallionellaceae bacterium]
MKTCDVLFQSRQPDSLAALSMGIWLSVTFPVDPELTVAMLIHVVDETPNDSDGAAVAAITARYVVDLRADDTQHESQSLLPRLATVVEALVGDKWWFDRDVLRSRLPD